MIEATSCGGVVIFRGKILLLYKNYKNKYEGWVLPKGTVEAGEEYPDTATREVLEETGVKAAIIKYVGKSQMCIRDRVISTQVQEEDLKIEKSLRPQTLDDYIGQQKAKENLKIYIEAAKARGESLDHVLFYGPPGLGKTTLCLLYTSRCV